MRFHLGTIAGAAAVGSLLAVSPAAADEAPCDFTISAVPFVINTLGHYCLTANVWYTSPTGSAITINANGVLLDLKGYKIGGGAAGIGTQATGVYVTNRNMVVVRNGTLRGFYAGVWFAAGSNNNNNLAEKLTLDGNTAFGVLVAYGNNNTVRDCIVSNTGGTTEAITFTTGIYNGSQPGFVLNNTVSNTFPAAGGLVRHGIIVADGHAVDNRIFGDWGFTGTNICLHVSNGFYRDNLASGCLTPYSGNGKAVGNSNAP